MRWGIKSAVVIIAAAAIVAVLAILLHRPHAPLPKPVAIDTTGQPTLGNPKAKIHMVIFEDLKCVNCMYYNISLFPTLRTKYIDTGKAQYTVINLAFLPGSLAAAHAARCLYAQNPSFFFPYIDNIYRNQPPESSHWTTIPKLVHFAANIPGVDSDKLSQCIANRPYAAFIDRNLALSKVVMGGTVFTPRLYINGYLVDPLTLEQVESVIHSIPH